MKRQVVAYLAASLCMATVCLEAASSPTRIELAAIPGLRYDFQRFTVAPGAEVVLRLSNNDIMLHNLVITKPGARIAIVEQANTLGNKGLDQQFVPESDQVLWSIGLVPEGESQSLRFTAPEQEGDYPYVCTYPGHGFVMFGTMEVSRTPAPPVKSVALVLAAPTGATGTIDPNRTQMRRAFMPNSGPASIAVMLPGKQSYCWDTGACRFRYAWSGDGLKSNVPSSKGVAPEKLLGEVYYTERLSYPLVIGDRADVYPEIEFLGYRRDAQGRPEFEYKVDGVTIREFIEFKDGLLHRRFRTDNQSKAIRFRIAADRAGQLFSSTKPKDGYFHYPPAASREFTITINPEAVQ